MRAEFASFGSYPKLELVEPADTVREHHSSISGNGEMQFHDTTLHA